MADYLSVEKKESDTLLRNDRSERADEFESSVPDMRLL